MGTSLPAAVGHLHYLWWWVLDYAQDGDLSRFEPEDVAEAAMWDGDPVAFLEALIKAGFIDRDEDRLVIHDWDDYAGRLVDKRKANRERQRRWREQRVSNALVTRDKHVSNSSLTSDECVSNGATVPNPTQPNPTQPKDSPPSFHSLVNSNELTRSFNLGGPAGDPANDDQPDQKQTEQRDPEEPTNSKLIGELLLKYREILPKDKHTAGDAPFIGRLYNEFGYEAVLSAINELSYKIDRGFVPENPLVYLKAMVKAELVDKSRVHPIRASPKKKFPRTGKYADLYEN